MQSAQYWIDHLKLQAHPEGGYYRETYRAAANIPAAALSEEFSGARSFSTAIYFLLTSGDRSLFHRIKSDELWHFHAGDSLDIYVLGKDGLTVHGLGGNLDAGDQLQVVIPANHWFGAMVREKGSYTLSGCTVAPGFDFRDFEMAGRGELLREFPKYTDIIGKLT